MLSPLQQNPRLAYWLIMGGVGLVCLVIVLLYSKVDQNAINNRYSTPFRDRAAKATEFKDSQFNQRGMGMSESNIQKRQGRRYETY